MAVAFIGDMQACPPLMFSQNLRHDGGATGCRTSVGLFAAQAMLARESLHFCFANQQRVAVDGYGCLHFLIIMLAARNAQAIGIAVIKA